MLGLREPVEIEVIGKYAYYVDKDTREDRFKVLLEQRINLLFELCRYSLPSESS